MDSILEALKQIDASNTTYEEWIQIGMALKAEGYDCSVWDDWSKNDSRYKEGECDRKWGTFKGSSIPISGGTIIKMAKDTGWEPRGGFMDWDDTIEYDGDGLIYDPSNEMTPTEQLIKYLDTLFYDDEYVGYVTNDVWQNSDGKWIPKKGQYDRTVAELIDLLEKHPNDIGAVLGDSKEECGAWIRFNPVDGVGVKNENIVRFTHALVESDDMPISEQDAIYRKFELPIACLVHSGSRSLHAIVKVDAKDSEEYRKRVDFLYDFLNKNGLKIDRANRNPSRLSRLPGVMRNGVMQTLVDTNIGRSNWNEWMDFVEGNTDELPREKTSGEIRTKKENLEPQLIEGIVRIGHKMLISGSSKAGKSFLLIELAIALAEGRKWLGFQCKKTKVFYVNLEIAEKSLGNRIDEIHLAIGVEPKYEQDFVVWSLRGSSMPLDKLAPKIIRKVANKGYEAIIIDPIYKVITGDENNATQMSSFTALFDKISKETGCTIIYSHHHSKGAQGFKRAMDRASGSGVFARDPDAQLDMIQLETDEDFMLQNADNPHSTAWRLESSLREFQNFKPVNFWFEYPLHRVDDAGILQKVYANGDPKGNLTKSSKRKQTPESRKEEFDTAFDINVEKDGTCTLSDLAEYLGVSTRTVRKRISEFNQDYSIENSVISQKNPE
jgi:RecA-family ATPase